MPQVIDRTALHIGTLFNGRYRLLSEIGQGGMGAVYRVHDTLLKRDVALKVLSKAGLGTEGRARFLHEARAAAQLNHPNIVSIYDAGVADGLPFIVMELVEGTSLYDHMPETLDEIVPVARQICTALAHAHANDIVHRDLKPENVIVTADGSVKLTDFGLALSVASRLTSEGGIVGTVFYVAPEVALGQAVDGRADLYALGVMLYEWTTGCLPFTADEPLAVISQHLYAPLVPPHAHQPEISPTLDALIVRLLSKRPQDRPASALEVQQVLENLEAAPAAIAQLDTLDRVVRGRLVGRERELAEVAALWRRVVSGSEDACVLLVSGEPGIGKTRLVRELTAHVAVSGGQVLVGECYAEGGTPYAPFAQMIQDTIGDGSDNGLPNFVLSDLITIAPALRANYPDVPPTPALDPQVERQRVFESVVTWFSALATRAPVLLFVDDAHWAGSDTLSLLRHLARRTRRLRVLIVLTYREVELDDAGPLQTLLYDLNRERLVVRVKLTRLDRDQTGELLATILAPHGEVDQELVDAIYRETEGNPFFIEEVCKALIEEEKLRYREGRWDAPNLHAMEIPQSVRVTVQSRLARLPAQTQDVLRIAAILGREFDFDTLRAASELDEDALIDALESAERAQVITDVRRGETLTTSFAFAHSLFPTTLRDSASLLRRQRLHRRVAAAIEAAQPDDFEALAYHYEQAGDPLRARRYYTCAGDRALAVYAHREAERYYRSALELSDSDPDRAPLLSGLGEVLFRRGLYDAAGQAWRDAIKLYQTLGDHDSLARLYARSARAAWYADDWPRGLALCREGLNIIPDGLESPGVATLVHETARACFFNHLADEALPLCHQALEMSQRLGLVEVQADTLATLGILPNQPFEAKRQALEQAVQLAESAGLLFTASRAHVNLGGRLQEAGHLETAREHFLRAMDLARQMGMKSLEYDSLAALTDVLLLLGDFKSVEENLLTLRHMQDSLPNPDRAALYTCLLEATLKRRQGERDEAARLFRQCRAPAREQKDPKYQVQMNAALAEVLLRLGHLDAAEEALAEALQVADDHPHAPRAVPLSLLSVLRVRQGQLDAAGPLLDQARAHLGSEHSRWDESTFQWAAAQLAVAQGRWPEAMADFESAVQSVAQLGDRWLQAWLKADWARAHVARGERDDYGRAQELFREALTIFASLPAPCYVESVEEQLKALTPEE